MADIQLLDLFINCADQLNVLLSINQLLLILDECNSQIQLPPKYFIG